MRVRPRAGGCDEAWHQPAHAAQGPRCTCGASRAAPRLLEHWPSLQAPARLLRLRQPVCTWCAPWAAAAPWCGRPPLPHGDHPDEPNGSNVLHSPEAARAHRAPAAWCTCRGGGGAHPGQRSAHSAGCTCSAGQVQVLSRASAPRQGQSRPLAAHLPRSVVLPAALHGHLPATACSSPPLTAGSQRSRRPAEELALAQAPGHWMACTSDSWPRAPGGLDRRPGRPRLCLRGQHLAPRGPPGCSRAGSGGGRAVGTTGQQQPVRPSSRRSAAGLAGGGARGCSPARQSHPVTASLAGVGACPAQQLRPFMAWQHQPEPACQAAASRSGQRGAGARPRPPRSSGRWPADGDPEARAAAQAPAVQAAGSGARVPAAGLWPSLRPWLSRTCCRRGRHRPPGLSACRPARQRAGAARGSTCGPTCSLAEADVAVGAQAGRGARRSPAGPAGVHGGEAGAPEQPGQPGVSTCGRARRGSRACPWLCAADCGARAAALYEAGRGAHSHQLQLTWPR